MELYWRETKRGMNLVVLTDDGDEFVVGGVRGTKRGIEAIANTTGYDPGRAIKGLSSVEKGREFVEHLEPWRDFFPQPLELDGVVRPLAQE